MMNNVKRMCVNEKKFVCAFLEYCYCKKKCLLCLCVCKQSEGMERKHFGFLDTVARVKLRVELDELS